MGQVIIAHRDNLDIYFPTLIILTRVAINILLAFVNNRARQKQLGQPLN